MSTVTPYIFFGGNCREAMNFYAKCFGGEVHFMTYGEAPASEGAKGRIIHARLTAGNFLLLGSDFPEGGPTVGNNLHLSVMCTSNQELENIFKTLSQEGQVHQPLHDAFWGARFGMLTDRYGFNWMLAYELPKK